MDTLRELRMIKYCENHARSRPANKTITGQVHQTLRPINQTSQANLIVAAIPFCLFHRKLTISLKIYDARYDS